MSGCSLSHVPPGVSALPPIINHCQQLSPLTVRHPLTVRYHPSYLRCILPLFVCLQHISRGHVFASFPPFLPSFLVPSFLVPSSCFPSLPPYFPLSMDPMTIVHKNHRKTSPHIACHASYLRFGSLLQLYAPSYLMAPRKSGVSHKVCITGPYARPQEETASAPDASTSSVALPAHVLSLAQVAAARETAHSKYITQLQSLYFFLHVQQSIILLNVPRTQS